MVAGRGQDGVKIAERFEIADKIQIAQRRIKREIAAQGQRFFVDLKRQVRRCPLVSST